ncbi:MAG: DUF3106 domain-containing protein, partial [Deltaproteobacteria bacterium]|nr:DUF3106 domain-containing protein [Deltaproteobacteria bacterium]
MENKVLRIYASIVFIFVFCLLLPNSLLAQEFSDLNPQQQRVLQQHAASWDLLSVEKQRTLQKGADKWLAMTPEQRTQANQHLEQWRGLTPDQKQKVRNRFERFKQLTPVQKQRLRTTGSKYLELPVATRQRLKQRWQKMTPEQKLHFRNKLESSKKNQQDSFMKSNSNFGKSSTGGPTSIRS